MVKNRSAMCRKNTQKLRVAEAKRTHCWDSETSNSQPWCWRMMPEAPLRELTFPSFLKDGFSLLTLPSYKWSLTEVYLFGEAGSTVPLLQKQLLRHILHLQCSRWLMWGWAVTNMKYSLYHCSFTLLIAGSLLSTRLYILLVRNQWRGVLQSQCGYNKVMSWS